MANRKEHAATGGFIGLLGGIALNLYKQNERKQLNPEYKFDWAELFLYSAGGAGIGATAGVLPDLLEPATDPNHRKFFHSVVVGTAVGVGMYKANQSELHGDTKAAINIAGAGYLSHLLLDSGTPNGIPAI